ncbi:MAG: N-formylglutamate deformylase [Hyphomicrobiales bacterium]|nr:N-formylglutamate deformylase [Hyphomicrobiales bacterium]
MNATPDWLIVTRQDAPLILSVPHAGTELGAFEPRFVSPWLARRDADWHIDALYDFAAALGATIVRTKISRSVIDVNRDPSGASLYPGQATTELCPTTTFDGEPLYRAGEAPGAAEIEERRRTYFDPYHQALRDEIARLRARHPRIALFDAHSIRSRIPRLFEGELPIFNLGTNSGKSCDPALREIARANVAASGESYVLDGRFKGGWITRSLGRPEEGVHALQMELACRAYMREPEPVDEANWPTPLDERAEPTRATLRRVLEAIAAWVRE